jgi:hypothetical protein
MINYYGELQFNYYALLYDTDSYCCSIYKTFEPKSLNKHIYIYDNFIDVIRKYSQNPVYPIFASNICNTECITIFEIYEYYKDHP